MTHIFKCSFQLKEVGWGYGISFRRYDQSCDISIMTFSTKACHSRLRTSLVACIGFKSLPVHCISLKKTLLVRISLAMILVYRLIKLYDISGRRGT